MIGTEQAPPNHAHEPLTLRKELSNHGDFKLVYLLIIRLASRPGPS
jgi:hypothetical protein